MFPFIVTFVGMILCAIGTVIFFRNADNKELPTEKFFSRFLPAWVIFVIGIAALITAFVSFLFSLVRG